MNSREKIHIYQNSYTNPFFVALADFGVNLDRLQEKSPIHQYNLDKLDRYVPALLLEAHLEAVFGDQGLTSIDRVFHPYFQLDMMGEFGTYLASLPSAFSVVLDSIKSESILYSCCKSRLVFHGATSSYRWKFFNKKTRGRQFSEQINFLLNREALLAFMGKTYSIIEILVPRYNEMQIQPLLPKGNFNLSLTEDEYGFVFPTTFLTKTSESANNSNEFNAESIITSRGKINELLNSMKPGAMPKLKVIAEQLNLTERSIARNLKAEGTNFREILAEHTLVRALELLHQGDLSIKEISQNLGYEESGNFIRSFKRATGYSPLHYRDAI